MRKIKSVNIPREMSDYLDELSLERKVFRSDLVEEILYAVNEKISLANNCIARSFYIDEKLLDVDVISFSEYIRTAISEYRNHPEIYNQPKPDPIPKEIEQPVYADPSIISIDNKIFHVRSTI